MTQGTKIGLLVSLAFLIVIFVLLSDHAASTSDAKPALVTAAGPQVQKGIATPGTAGGPAAAPAPTETAATPTQQVVTGDEMTAKAKPGMTQVVVGPGQAGAPVEIAANNNLQTTRTLAPIHVGPGSDTYVRSLADARNPTGTGDFVPVDRLGSSTPDPTIAQAPKPQEYKAMPGDTVSRMSRKFYGVDTKPLRDLIVAANKSLKGDPNRIEVGHLYVIPPKPVPPTPAASPAAAVPAAGSGSPTLAVASAAAGAESHAATTQPAPAASATPAERIYVVKEGDNLWKIAKEQCKDANAVDQIKKLNRDVLKNGIELKIGMKLHLPVK